MLHQRMQIFCDRAGLGTSGRIRPAAAPSPPVEGDNAISRLDKARNVRLPAVRIACVRMKQYDWDAGTASVRVPEANAGEIRVSGKPRYRSLRRGCDKQEQRSRLWVQAQERRSAEANNHQMRPVHQTSPKASTS